MQALLAFLAGLLMGSFLNVCVHRWPRNRSIIRPRSHCVRCRKMIAWYDNIPVVSYVILGGRCRHCKRPISWRYPAVELMTGALFGLSVIQYGPTLAALKLCVYGWLLIGLMFSDLEKRLLPDEMTKGGMLLGIVFSWFVPVHDLIASSVYWLVTHRDIPQTFRSPVESLFGAIVPALLLNTAGWLYMKFRQKEGLGFGDVKLIGMVGSFVGLTGAIQTLLFGSVAGSIIGMAYIKIAKKNAAEYELPFGTFLGAVALLLALLDVTP